MNRRLGGCVQPGNRFRFRFVRACARSGCLVRSGPEISFGPFPFSLLWRSPFTFPLIDNQVVPSETKWDQARPSIQYIKYPMFWSARPRRTRIRNKHPSMKHAPDRLPYKHTTMIQASEHLRYKHPITEQAFEHYTKERHTPTYIHIA